MVSDHLISYTYKMFKDGQIHEGNIQGYSTFEVAQKLLKEKPLFCHGGNGFLPYIYVGIDTNQEVRLWRSQSE